MATFMSRSLYLLVFLVVTSCGQPGATSVPGNEEALRSEPEEVIALDTCLRMSDEIDYYLPEMIRKHEDASEYIREYLAAGDKFYTSLNDNLENMAALKMDVTEMNEVNDGGSDIVAMVSNTRKAYKNLRHSSMGVLGTIWSGKDLLVLEERRNELMTKYSNAVQEALDSCERAVDKYLYYAYVEPFKRESERIENGTSIRSIPTVYADEAKEGMKFDALLNSFIELQAEGNAIKKILAFNELEMNECSELVSDEIADIMRFWTGEEHDLTPRTKLFSAFTKKLVTVKRELRGRLVQLNENSEDRNERAITALKEVCDRYDNVVQELLAELEPNQMPQPAWKLFRETKQDSK
jgi:hypothetical protein